jgi:lipopolysaccharide biosynthesis regulator YciM
MMWILGDFHAQFNLNLRPSQLYIVDLDILTCRHHMQTGILTTIIKRAREIECHRCSRKWFYAGANEFFCSCPSCRTTVTISPKRLKEKGAPR